MKWVKVTQMDGNLLPGYLSTWEMVNGSVESLTIANAAGTPLLKICEKYGGLRVTVPEPPENGPDPEATRG